MHTGVSESSAAFIEGLVDDAREKGGRRNRTHYLHAYAYMYVCAHIRVCTRV